MTDDQRQKRIEKAQIRVMFQVPFFSPGVMRLPSVFDEKVETACTDGQVIRWGTKFFDGLDDQQLVTVLCHEVLHPMLGHLWRAPAGADHGLWNEACDHIVNGMLKGFGEARTAKGHADPFPFPPGSWCCNPAFKDFSEEYVYTLLPKNSGKGGRGGRRPFGEFVIGGKPGQNQAQAKAAKVDWARTLIQSAEIAKSRGELPAGLERLVNELIDPAVPWYDLLRNWLREQAADDWNWTKPNRLYAECDFVLPVLESEKMGPIVFATDTSGSIDQTMLARFQSEKQSCLDDLRPSRLVDIYCDAAIHKAKEYRLGEQIETDAPGGGGTNFRPVFAHVEKLGEVPKCLVYLTDLQGTFPTEAPDYPVLWVTWFEGGKAPFGEVIYAEV